MFGALNTIPIKGSVRTLVHFACGGSRNLAMNILCCSVWLFADNLLFQSTKLDTKRVILEINMKMKKKTSDPMLESQFSWKNMLTAIPMHNVAAKVKPGKASGTIRIEVPNKADWWHKIPPISWVVRPPKFNVLILDAIGAPLWDLCDGKTSVEQLVAFFAERHQLTFHESRVSVTSYLRLLIQRGALAVAL